MKKISVAIDGPAGAGKSTVAKLVSEELGLIYVDTGAMYRAVAFKAIKEDIDVRDFEKIQKMLVGTDIKLDNKSGEQEIFVDGENITSKIRTPEISLLASKVAKLNCVREVLVKIQRGIAEKQGVVMDGRDIGSNVLPNAELKIFLSASIDERAKRRMNDLGTCDDINFEIVKREIQMRDENDSKREIAPLIKTDDAKEIDTTSISIGQVVGQIVNYYENIAKGECE